MQRDLQHYEFLFEFLQNAHKYEVERLDKIRERISFISGFVLLLGTGLSSLLGNYTISFSDHPFRDGLFLFFLICAGITLTISAILIAICLLPRYRYSNAKPASDVLSHAKEWADYNAHPSVTEKRNVTLELKRQLCEVYALSSEYNRKRNKSRNDLLVAAMQTGFVAAIFALFPAGCLVDAKYSDADRPIQVQIAEPINVNLK